MVHLQSPAVSTVLHGSPVVQHLVLASTCTRCGRELRPPAKRNTVYVRTTGGRIEPHCPPCAKLVANA